MNSLYALIKNDIVENIIRTSIEFIESITDNYDYIINIDEVNPQPQVGWTYNGSVFTNPLQLLSLVKTNRLAEFQTQINAFLDAHYSLLTRTQLLNLYTLAEFDGLTNRAAYIRPAIDWVISVITYSATVLSNIQSLTTVDDVNNYVWHISPNVGTDPNITIGTAISITD